MMHPTMRRSGSLVFLLLVVSFFAISFVAGAPVESNSDNNDIFTTRKRHLRESPEKIDRLLKGSRGKENRGAKKEKSASAETVAEEVEVTNSSTVDVVTFDNATEFDQISNRIVDGRPASMNEYPFFAAIIKHQYGSMPDKLVCGGALIASDLVLSAAHCLETGIPHTIRVGAYREINAYRNDQVYHDSPIETYVKHYMFNWRTTDKDYAIFKLAKPVTDRRILNSIVKLNGIHNQISLMTVINSRQSVLGIWTTRLGTRSCHIRFRKSILHTCRTTGVELLDGLL